MFGQNKKKKNYDAKSSQREDCLVGGADDVKWVAGGKKTTKKTKPTCGGLCSLYVVQHLVWLGSDVGQILRVSVGGRKGG